MTMLLVSSVIKGLSCNYVRFGFGIIESVSCLQYECFNKVILWGMFTYSLSSVWLILLDFGTVSLFQYEWILDISGP